MIAKVAVSAANFAIDKPYSYIYPENMPLKAGMRVIVPFGRGNRQCEGIVLGLEDGKEDGLKQVQLCMDESPLLDGRMLQLAAFMRERYFCTFYEAARAMLPAGLWFQEKDLYALTQDQSWQENPPRNLQALTILQLLRDLGGQSDGDMLRRSFSDEDSFQKAVSYLVRKKWIVAQQSFSQKLHDKVEQVATLVASVEEAMEYAHSRPKSALMQKNVLELLCSVGSASVKEICYFTGAKTATVNRLQELGYIALTSRPVLRCRQIQKAQIEKPLVLSAAQQQAFAGLQAQMEEGNPGTALLYGVTGSGKTSVYIRLIQHCLEKGKQAILLVPEIALTPQLLGLMAAWFDDQVAVLHSSLPATERFDQWKRVAAGKASVVVGTRSAVFAPCPDLGLIILDEEQEHSYKSENNPRYHAAEVARWRGFKSGALVLLGSATPSVESMYRAKSGQYRLFTLKERYGGRSLPQVQIVDMRREMEQGNVTSISYALQDAIGKAAEDKKQSILFLNRRGASRALVCISCGESPECPRCSARLTFHSANKRLMCHYCGHSVPAADRCPSCGGPVKQVGTGTQKIQQELLELFPGMEAERMDTDTVNAVNTHEKILERFSQENIPVLVGTQMVAKGLNLPNVTLVGVLDGDLSLYADSYRAAETTFNMLTQVVGRAGRGDTKGTAVIQTLVPEHKVITLAAQQDYDSFYDLEVGVRQVQNLPPFGDLVHLTITGQDEAKVLRGGGKIASTLLACAKKPEYQQSILSVLGPAPCAVPKINYNFRYRLTLRCTLDKPLRTLLAHLLRQFAQDKENRGINVFADVNGYE